MAIWFPSKKDIKADKLELKKDDAIAIHRKSVGRDFQAPLGDSLDQRYAPLDHNHGTGDHNHDEEYAKVDHDHPDIKADLQNQQSLISENGQKLDQLQTDLDGHTHDGRYLRIAGGTATGKIEIIKPSGVAFEIKKSDPALRDTSGLKIWPDGACETTRTTFSDNHLVSSGHVKDTYAPKGHKHTTGDNTTFGPARYMWEYQDRTDPSDYSMTIDVASNYLRLACIPREPKVMWKVTNTHLEDLTIDAMWSVYEYEYKSNSTNHRRYNYKLIACGKTNLVKYYANQSGFFNRFRVNHWYKQPGSIAEGTKLWCTVAGLM